MRRPWFFAIAVSSLAIALGLATTIIAQIDSLMHPYTPIRDADRVFVLTSLGAGTGGQRPSAEDVAGAASEARIFKEIAEVASTYAVVEIGRGAVPAGIGFVGRPYFDLIGLTPRIGRLFSTDETFESGVAIVGDAYWKRYFNNAPKIGEATVTYGGRPFRVIGVGPAGWERSSGAGIWIPRGAPSTQVRRFANGEFMVRLADGISESQAAKALEQIGARWTTTYGVSRSKFRFWLRTVRPDPLQIESFHVALIGAAIFILVIASANVSALMLARSVGNRRDQALRRALGAGRRDLILDVVAEIGILAVTGAALGVLIGYAAMWIMTAFTPVEVSWLGFEKPNLSFRVFGGLFLAAIVCIAFSALIPAAYVARIAPAEPLKETSGTTTGRAHTRFRLLVVGEMALAMILLFGASLISKTAHMVSVFDFGYNARPVGNIQTNVLAVKELSPPPKDTVTAINSYRFYLEVRAADLAAIIARLRSVPGVQSAAWFSGDGADRMVISDRKGMVDTGFYNPALYNIGPSFLSTLGIPIIEGRDFTDGDRTEAGAVILDRRSAQQLFPNGSAVGHMVKLGPPDSRLPWVRIVGVAGDAIHKLPEYPEMTPPYVIYTTRQKANGMFVNFVYRADNSLMDLGPTVTRRMRDALPPRSRVETAKWIDEYETALAGRRFTAGIFATLSLASLALATAGLFGVLSYAVNQRMREFAIRIALGARRSSIVSLVMRDGAVMALGGTAVGAFVGMYAAFVVYDWLWGVYPVDAFSLIVAEIVLFTVTGMAALLPALRATRANPAEVIRSL
jgi:putative ABC transport system permease protein